MIWCVTNLLYFCTMDLCIRQVVIEDNAKLARIIRQVFDEFDAPHEGTVYSDPTTDDLFALFQTPKSVLWVAMMNNVPVGCCGIFPTLGLPDGCAELVKFYIARKARGKGAGQALMQQCIEWAKHNGYDQIYIESMPQFEKAVGMYEKQGFERLTHPMGNSGHFGCTIWMLKQL